MEAFGFVAITDIHPDVKHNLLKEGWELCL